MRSIAISRPTTAVLPPAAPAPDSGCSEPIRYGVAAPNAARHGAGTSIMAPMAPPPQPTRVRRVTLPLYQTSLAHSSFFHFSVIASSLRISCVARQRPRGCAIRQKALLCEIGTQSLTLRGDPTSRRRESDDRTPTPHGTTRHSQDPPSGPFAGSFLS